MNKTYTITLDAETMYSVSQLIRERQKEEPNIEWIARVVAEYRNAVTRAVKEQ